MGKKADAEKRTQEQTAAALKKIEAEVREFFWNA